MHALASFRPFGRMRRGARASATKIGCRLLLSILATTCLVAGLAAQDGATPLRTSGLEPDDLVRIRLGDESPVHIMGRVAFLRADSVFLEAGGNAPARGYAWGDISLLEERVSRRSRAALGATLGGLVGAGVGFGSAFCVLCSDSSEGSATLIGAVIGAAVGFGVGSAIRSETWTVVAAPGASGVTFGLEMAVGHTPFE